jgi:hypothetical protein
VSIYYLTMFLQKLEKFAKTCIKSKKVVFLQILASNIVKCKFILPFYFIILCLISNLYKVQYKQVYVHIVHIHIHLLHFQIHNYYYYHDYNTYTYTRTSERTLEFPTAIDAFCIMYLFIEISAWSGRAKCFKQNKHTHNEYYDCRSSFHPPYTWKLSTHRWGILQVVIYIYIYISVVACSCTTNAAAVIV